MPLGKLIETMMFKNIANFFRTKPPKKCYYGLDGLDKKLEEYINYDNGFFVELGANDGVSQSNTLYFEKFRNWRGVLIEPTPHNYLKCIQNRSKETKVLCSACVAFDYSEKFVEIVFSNLMSTPKGLESDIPNTAQHAREGLQFLDSGHVNFSFGAIARTLNSALIESGAPRLIDVLSLDVEGAEIEVLKGVDHNEFRFKFICIECRNEEKIIYYMNQIGYAFVTKISHHDLLFRNTKSANN
jgi:FkbM family methyltransferase